MIRRTIYLNYSNTEWDSLVFKERRVLNVFFFFFFRQSTVNRIQSDRRMMSMTQVDGFILMSGGDGECKGEDK